MTAEGQSARPGGPDRRRLRRLARVAAADIQNRVATALGVSGEHRIGTVITMLESNARRAPGYWIQLFLAMGIATLGLVLGSTAVVIGAMLVSPLMGPIVELGMGFAVGSSLLVIRAALRVVLSVAGVVAGAALLTVVLPFHEVTGEIAARTAPTALDLLVAVFCALTAAYTTVRPSTDTTAAAAGTAIGISLVPPLCVTGFGIGTGSGDIASGAALLFTANFSAILVFAVLAFLALGYNRVNARLLEHDYLEHDGSRAGRIAERAHRVLRTAFGSRYGLAMRVAIPGVFLAAVYVPLRHALDEVTWQVRVRDAIRRVLASEAESAVQTSLVVERHTVALRLLVVGAPAEAARLERRLEMRIAAVAGVDPVVAVVAVPDVEVLAAVTARGNLAAPAAPAAVDVGALAGRVGEALAGAWPTAAAGALVGWSLDPAVRGGPIVTTRHLGAPLGDAAEVLLSRSLSAHLGSAVRVRDVALPANPVAARAGEQAAWLGAALGIASHVAQTEGLVACVRGPLRPRGRTAALDRALAGALRASDAAERLVLEDGAAWSIRAARGSCAAGDGAAPTAAPASARPADTP